MLPHKKGKGPNGHGSKGLEKLAAVEEDVIALHAPMMSTHDSHGKEHVHSNNGTFSKRLSLILVGIVTLLYVIAEFAISVRAKSLVLLSDAFHNLSDLVSIVVAYWAIAKSSGSSASDQMSYGWRRSEVVGAMVNACSLVALCLFIALEALPKFVYPEALKVDITFICIAACGILVNAFGAFLFWLSGTHAHAHAHEEEAGPVEYDDPFENNVVVELSKEHAHTHQDSADAEEERDEHEVAQNDLTKKRNKHEAHAKDHQHKHKEHAHKDHKHTDHKHVHKDHQHKHKRDQESREKHSHGGPSHDMNMWAVFLHFVGDAFSAVLVLVTALLAYFYQKKPNGHWTEYLDPAASILIAGIMLWSAFPLVKQCSHILLQRVPRSVQLGTLRDRLASIPQVSGVHDLHVWQLSDSLIIATVHIRIISAEYTNVVLKAARAVFHRSNIHSNTIQLETQDELAPSASNPHSDEQPLLEHCEQNCKDDCAEDWCCKDTYKLD